MSEKVVQKNLILVGIIFLVTVVSYQYFHSVQVKYLSITTFNDCVDAGYKVLSTYPEKCIMPGKSFVNPAQTETSTSSNKESSAIMSNDYRNISYSINDQQVLLTDGKSLVLGNTTFKKGTTTVDIFGKPFQFDINDDNKEDVVLLLKVTKNDTTQEAYYVTSAIALNTGYSGTNAIYLDSNLRSAAFLYKNGEIVLGYTTQEATSTLKEKYFTFSNNLLKQVIHK